ncbi:two-component SAPR family response regulator [Paenibacillus turicensis]|uniref:Two-component SAPR family response regulator n=1 Tax=Paenibacillus turicensis TaxID=160487 RepID=A0ABS4FME0_9BACL|nr:response regulator [Paenibacillus turicensis]MBP1903741.1 two-component SAPR family response regulator [Paenibacillus turicensis]
MFRVVIVEDEKPILELMKVVVGRNPYCEVVGAYSNPFQALEAIPLLKPDIAFLDVEMPKLSGLELAQEINDCCEQTRIVFTTAHKEYALEAFNVFAFDYILKPITPASVQRITDRIIKTIDRSVDLVDSHPRNKVTIRCFGSFEVRNSMGSLIRWPTRKTEELFAYLLCYPNQEAEKWQLIDALWSDMDEERAVHNLHNTVYRLKKILKEHELGLDVRKTGRGYQLETFSNSYDLLEFQGYPPTLSDSQEDISRLENLCSMYQGHLFDRKDYLWKHRLEEEYSKRFMSMVQNLGRLYLVLKDWERAEQRLNSFLMIYPFDENINLLLMKVYVSSGRLEQMNRHYTDFASRYSREFGIAPPQEVKSLVDVFFSKGQG